VASGFGRYPPGSSWQTVLIRLKESRDLADTSLNGLNAAYSNAGFIGLPLCMLAFGHASLALAVIGMIMTVCVLFAVAIVLVELGLQTEKKLVATMSKVLTNPLLFAPFAGWLGSGTGLKLSGGADTFPNLLGAAASPCALGLFLGEKREVGRRRGENHHDAGLGQARCAAVAQVVAGVSRVRAAGVVGEDGGHTERVTDRNGAVHADGIS
jgi:malonate transporter and related proteins